jgi:hypothetical protein
MPGKVNFEITNELTVKGIIAFIKGFDRPERTEAQVL